MDTKAELPDNLIDNTIAAPHTSKTKRISSALLLIASLVLLVYAYSIWRQLS